MITRELKPILVLGLCAFVMILTEFAPISLLTNIATNFETKTSIIGLSVSIYAIIGATFGLFCSFVFNKINRKKLFIVIFLILLISNTAILFFDNIVGFFFFRSLCAIGHGMFWAIVADYSIKIVSIKNRGIASSIVFSSIPIATVTGLPILNYIGNQFDWFFPFSLISILSIFCLILIIFFIPNIDTEFDNEPIILKNLLRNKLASLLILITGVVSISHFCSFTYIEPYIRSLSFFNNDKLLTILLIFGISGIIGNIITMKFMNSFIEKLTLIFLIIMLSSLLLIFFIGYEISFYLFLLLIFLWGASISVLFTCLQTWVITVSNKNSAIMAAINSAILNYSIGIGSIIGAGIVSEFNTKWIFFCSSLFLLIGFIYLFISFFKETIK